LSKKYFDCRKWHFLEKITNFGHDWLLCCCEQLISWAGQEISDRDKYTLKKISWAGQEISDQTIEIKRSENVLSIFVNPEKNAIIIISSI
jgi:hypothetical protein